MRLYNTATRKLDDLPPPPGPIRMYFCGPTVYQRIHVGNARPFIVSMWLKRWLEHEGYDVTLVENITDINDKIYAAAPGRSAELAAQASQWYIDDTGDLGLGRPDHEPKATESIDEIVALIQELVDRELAYPAGGDVYYRVDRYPDYGVLSGRLDEESVRNPSEEEEQSSLKESPRDFALWKGRKQGEDTSWESPWGRGRPGLAHRVLGDGREASGAGVRDPRRGARPRLPAPRERDRPVARRGPRVRAAVDAQRDAAAWRRKDVEVARQPRVAPRRARRVGAGNDSDALPRELIGGSRSTTPTRRSVRQKRVRTAFARCSATRPRRADPGTIS